MSSVGMLRHLKIKEKKVFRIENDFEKLKTYIYPIFDK